MSQGSGSDRRGFLVAAGRYALALVLGGGVGAMVAREGEECAGRGMCRGCGVLETCELAEAVEEREARRERRG